MIRSIQHRGLRRLYETGETRELKQDQVRRFRCVLGILDTALCIEDVDQLTGMRVHGLKGDLEGFWSVSITGNWRIIFRFEDGEAADLDLVDYH